MTERETLIELKNIKQHFRINKNMTIRAVDGADLRIERGEVFGLAGESGCGKSTLARITAGIYRPTEGEVLYDGVLISGRGASKDQLRKLKREMQIIFQDPSSSLNSKMTVENIIAEPLMIRGNVPGRGDMKARVITAAEDAGLPPDLLKRRPGELSGGQRQRAAIARSLITDPKFLIADEPAASLDVSTGAEIMDLLTRLHEERRFTMLFISHDLDAVRYMTGRAGIMLKGKIVETAETERLFSDPVHPYTKELISAEHMTCRMIRQYYI